MFVGGEIDSRRHLKRGREDFADVISMAVNRVDPFIIPSLLQPLQQAVPAIDHPPLSMGAE